MMHLAMTVMESLEMTHSGKTVDKKWLQPALTRLPYPKRSQQKPLHVTEELQICQAPTKKSRKCSGLGGE